MNFSLKTAPPADKLVLLGKTMDSHLILHSYLTQLCKKIANKLNALASIAP